jgi:hypothetical protein
VQFGPEDVAQGEHVSVVKVKVIHTHIQAELCWSVPSGCTSSGSLLSHSILTH